MRTGVQGAFWIVLSIVLGLQAPGEAHPLKGSRSSLNRQNRSARAHDFTYLRTAGGVRKFVRAGYLVPVRETRDLRIGAVSFPYARPEVKTFLERLSSQYRRACGKRLVVTSLTRPKSHQPPNASRYSVHPTGMAVDLRRSQRASCRAWLERVLITLERRGVVEATRERYPPHYHVAVFPDPYTRYVEQLTTKVQTASAKSAGGSPGESDAAAADSIGHRVRRGQSLWSIARHYETSVHQIRRANDLSRSRIYPGQVLRIPVHSSDS